MHIKTGKYRHYKGSEYEVLSTARHSETEAWFVVYKTCYGDCSTWIRPLEMFTEMVEVDGQSVPRFAYIGDEKPQRHRNTLSVNHSSNENDEVLAALNDSLRQ